MFGSEDEYKNPLINSMRVAIVSHNIQNIELATRIQERIILGFKKKLQFTQVENITDLFKYREVQKEENIKGLIDKKWITNVINFIPSVIIINYQLQLGANKEPDEKNIFNMLLEIRNYTKSCSIFLIVINKDNNENQIHFNFDNKEKLYYLRFYMTKDKDYLYIFEEEQIWKFNDFGDICNKIFNSARQFYTVNKKAFKDKRIQSKTREEKIEYDIKLGIISVIKSRKENTYYSKYLEEAYEILCDKNFDLNNYKYGNKPISIKNNLYEIRAVADWLFFKSNNVKNKRRNSISVKNREIKNNSIIDRSNSLVNKINIDELIKKCERHISCFRNKNYYDNGEKDYFHFVEYFWISQRYTNISDYIEENISNIKLSKKKLIKLGSIYFKEVYNFIRMLKYYKEYFNDSNFNLSTFEFNGKKIDIKDIEEEPNIYFGKPPSYYIQTKEGENKKEIIGFNDEIYIKKFLLHNEINYDDLIENFKEKFLFQLTSFFYKLKGDKFFNKTNNNYYNNNDDMKGIDIYINKLKIIGLNIDLKNETKIISNNSKEINYMNTLYPKIIYNYDRIKKFPKVYMDYIKQYIGFIQFKLKMNNSQSRIDFYKTELLINISLLANMRKLDSDEEKIFFEILNDTQFSLMRENKEKEIIIKLNYYNKNNLNIINTNDLGLNLDYNIKDIDKYQERKILDLVEYDIKFNTTLSHEKIKFNSLKLFLEYSNDDKNKNKEIIIKEFNKEELNKYELCFNSPVIILHKILLKYKTGKILLKKIMFSLCKKENVYYSIDLPNEINKTIFLNGMETKVLNIQYPGKTLITGVNQLFKFQYIVNKEPINNIKINDYKHEFIGNPLDNNTLSQIYDEYIDSNNEKKARSKVSGSHHISNNKNNQKEIYSSSIIEFVFLKNNFDRKKSFDNTTDIELVPPTFFFFDVQSETMEESKNCFEYIYNDFESRLEEGKNKYEVLVKFLKSGLYLIKLNIKYIIKHDDIDVNLEFNEEEKFYFRVIDPLSLTYNILSKNYLLYSNIKNKNQKSKEYLTDTNINMNLIFNNLLDEDILIKDLILELDESKNIEIHSTVKDIIEDKDLEKEIKEQILCIIQSSNYVVPYDLKFMNSFSGHLGKIKLIWTTKSLMEYERKIKNNFNFFNKNEFNLPKIDVNIIKIIFNYEYTIKDNKEIILNIKISNNSIYNKKLLVFIENIDDNSYIISGLTKYSINLKYGEVKKILAKLIVLQIGELKLPDIVVKEIDISGKEKYTNYYISEKILIQ